MNFTATNIFKEITTVQYSHKYKPSVNLPCFQKGLYCAGTKNISILPPSIKCMKEKKAALKRHMHTPFTQMMECLIFKNHS